MLRAAPGIALRRTMNPLSAEPDAEQSRGAFVGSFAEKTGPCRISVRLTAGWRYCRENHSRLFSFDIAVSVDMRDYPIAVRTGLRQAAKFS